MRLLTRASCLLTVFSTLLSVDAFPQCERRIIVSSRVGALIDSTEAAAYGLFRTTQNFYSAQFCQAPDSTFRLVVTKKSAQDIIAGTAMAISYWVLEQFAERINHYEAILGGTYLPGSAKPQIQFEDGGLVTFSGETIITPTPTVRVDSSDFLPLATNRTGLTRPVFSTIHFGLNLGVSIVDFSDLQPLIGSVPNIAFSIGGHMKIPVVTEPSISLVTGLGLKPGGGKGGITSFSTFILSEVGLSRSMRTLIGFGVERAYYSYSKDFIIHASQTYPIVMLGVNLADSGLDVVLTYPFAREQQKRFEDKVYSILPAGPALGLALSLR